MVTLAADRRAAPPGVRHGHVTHTASLLGLGRVGQAVARAAAEPGSTIGIGAVLVRDRARQRTTPLGADALHTEPGALFAPRPRVIIEALGGLEPAYDLAARALDLGIPVVTANKSLVARRGADLARRAAGAGVAFRYEAAVVAGVPFLGALAWRPRAAAVSRLTGIVNGTSNFILTRLAAGTSFDAALHEAQHHGLAEPDPRADVDGVDAAEKLAVLLWHLGWSSAGPDAIETSGIRALAPADALAAAALGGSIKPVVLAGRDAAGAVSAFAAPAFVSADHPLHGISGVTNAVILRTRHGDVLHAGPGAGPDATAATLLDDAREAIEGVPPPVPAAPDAAIGEAVTGWILRLDAAGGPPDVDCADLLASYGVWLRRTARAGGAFCARTYAVDTPRLRAAAAALHAAAGIPVAALRAVED